MFIEGTDHSSATSLHLHRLNLNGRFITFEGRSTGTQKQVRTIHRKTMNPLSYEKWSCEKARLLSKHLSQEVSGP
jgi:hypothetical protein